EASIADLVDSGSFLGEPQGMAEWQHLNRGADLHSTRALGNGGSKDQWRCQDRAIGGEMQLCKPHGIESPLLGGVDQREGLRKGFCFARVPRFLKFVEQTEFHRSCPIDRLFLTATVDSSGRRNGWKRPRGLALESRRVNKAPG